MRLLQSVLRSLKTNQETAVQVCHPSVGTFAHAPWPRHLSQSESLQPLSRKDILTVVRQRL